MSSTNKIIELINKLSEKTKARKIKWTISSRDSEYVYHFSDGSVTADFWNDERSGYGYVDFAVYNSNGVQIERIYLGENEEGYKFLLDFYTLVKDSYLKIDETYNSLFDELNKL